MQSHVRLATTEDVPALNALIASSARVLSRGYYSEQQIDALVRFVFGVDSQLVEDRTYFLIERNGEIAACGGWSARRSIFGGDQAKSGVDAKLNPATESARIRAFFVHPDYARQGLGRALLAHCEAEARRAGFGTAELMSTLPGVPLYQALGYREVEPVSYTMPDGTRVDFVRMSHSLVDSEHRDTR
jgi:GNAT superfamily N-acetyltransferase